MDSNSIEKNENIQENTESEVGAPVQNLSSEESFSPDYELYSKKTSNKSVLVWVVLGVLIFLIILASVLYFTGYYKTLLKF